ncbi:MAG: Na+/H+ antiporter subunit E [Deltaproteobacteria bacterium]|nr:Na+/H+ antiporter subunit E [Deltaproteobacteria bacterium]
MKVQTKWKVIRIIYTFFVLMLLWMMFTFSLNFFSLLLGGIVCCVVAFFTYDFFIEEHEVHIKDLFPRLELFLLFLFTLLVKIYLASFDTAWRVITGRIDPKIIRIRTRLKSDLAQTILANAITLTPGTLTIDTEGDYLYVHWLRSKTTHTQYAADLIKGHFEIWLRRIFY